MGVRWVDGSWHAGSLIPEDPHAAARRLQTYLPGYMVWYGEKTGRFFALPDGVNVLILAVTTSDLIEEINSRRRAAVVSDRGAAGRC